MSENPEKAKMKEKDLPKIADKKPLVFEIEPGSYHWCTCGLSAKQPYCDGSHKGTEFRPQRFTVEEKKRVALCLCKLSKNGPFCDGAHKDLKDSK